MKRRSKTYYTNNSGEIFKITKKCYAAYYFGHKSRYRVFKLIDGEWISQNETIMGKPEGWNPVTGFKLIELKFLDLL